jgi:hypothetical protein
MLRPLENRASECVKKRGGANGEGGEMCGSGLGGSLEGEQRECRRKACIRPSQER